MDRDRVLIAGGGIAGLAAAAALQLRGIPFLVLERRQDPPDGGLGLNLPGNAVVALQALGLGDALARMGMPVRRREYRNQRGRLLFSVDEDAFWGVEARPRCVLRSDLHAALRSLVRPAALRLGSDVRRVHIRDDFVEVDLADETAEDGGVLVAADGVRSAIRAHVLSDRPPQAALLSRTSWRFITRNPGVDCWVAWTGARSTALLIPVGDHQVYGWVSVRDERLTDFPQVAAQFTDFPPIVGEALAAAQAEPVPPYHSPLEEVRPAAWTSGRVVLTGDAAHATAPVWAQGAGLAVEDGLALADILAAPDRWPDLGAEFARRRRERVEHVQTMTDRLSRTAMLPTWLRDLVLPLTGPRTYRATYGPLRKGGF